MSKIICEVCGTSYPETALQCPICGYVRPADSQSVMIENSEVHTPSTYQHVKGGRFSKANVNKRAASTQSASHAAVRSKGSPKKRDSSNRGLVITIFVLLLAILAVIGYIVVRFFATPEKDDAAGAAITVEKPAESDAQITELEILCQSIEIANNPVVVQSIGHKASLRAAAVPSNTTEQMLYSSDNEDVVTVDEAGVLMTTGFGNAVITITCGSVSVTCDVIVEEPIALDMENLTLTGVGESVRIYSGNIPVEEISWFSDNEAVVTVQAGYVTALSNGTATVRGEYNSQIVECVVYCNIPEPETTEPQNPDAHPKPYSLKNLMSNYATDVSLKVGKSFTLMLVDANGDEIQNVTWEVTGGSACTVSNGTVTAVSAGTVKVVATYDGESFTCVVRVS